MKFSTMTKVLVCAAYIATIFLCVWLFRVSIWPALLRFLIANGVKGL